LNPWLDTGVESDLLNTAELFLQNGAEERQDIISRLSAVTMDIRDKSFLKHKNSG
jgi:hypothetical protein